MGFTLWVSQALVADSGPLPCGLAPLADGGRPGDENARLSLQLAVVQLLLTDGLSDLAARAQGAGDDDEDLAGLQRLGEHMRRDLAQLGRAVQAFPAAAMEGTLAAPRSGRVPVRSALRLLPREWRMAGALARGVGDEAIAAWARRRAAAYARFQPEREAAGAITSESPYSP